MSALSLSDLNQRLQQLKTSDLAALQHYSERQFATRAIQNEKATMMIIHAVCLLAASFLYSDLLSVLFTVGLGFGFLALGTWGFVRFDYRHLLSAGAIAAFYSLFLLLYRVIWLPEFNSFDFIFSVIFVGIALYYIEHANRLKASPKRKIREHIEQLYTDIQATLRQQKPNTSNKLIEVQQLTQRIIIWLRPTTVIILATGQKRLYIDLQQTFEMVIEDKDNGGETLHIEARYDAQSHQGRISRHGWLRYLHFVHSRSINKN